MVTWNLRICTHLHIYIPKYQCPRIYTYLSINVLPFFVYIQICTECCSFVAKEVGALPVPLRQRAAPPQVVPQRGPFARAKPLSKARSWQAVSLACVAVPSAPGVSVFGFIRPVKIHYIPHFLDATLWPFLGTSNTLLMLRSQLSPETFQHTLGVSFLERPTLFWCCYALNFSWNFQTAFGVTLLFFLEQSSMLLTLHCTCFRC